MAALADGEEAPMPHRADSGMEVYLVPLALRMELEPSQGPVLSAFPGETWILGEPALCSTPHSPCSGPSCAHGICWID